MIFLFSFIRASLNSSLIISNIMIKPPTTSNNQHVIPQLMNNTHLTTNEHSGIFWDNDIKSIINIYRNIFTNVNTVNLSEYDYTVNFKKTLRLTFDGETYSRYYKARNIYYRWGNIVKSIIDKDITRCIHYLSNGEMTEVVNNTIEGLRFISECLEQILKFKLSFKKYHSSSLFIINHNKALKSQIHTFFKEVPIIGIFEIINKNIQKDLKCPVLQMEFDNLRRNLYKMIRSKNSALKTIDTLNQILTDLNLKEVS